MRRDGAKWGRIVAVFTALALVAAACGGDEQEPAATTVALRVAGAPELTDDFSVQHARWAQETVDTSEFKKDPPYNIATVVQGPTNGWGTIFDVVMNYELEQSGLIADQLYVPWDFTTESQANGIDDAVAKDVDIILLTSLSRAGLVAPVERAVAAGIPVLTCMATVAGDGPTVDVSQNIPQQGFASATGLAEMLGGSGKVVLLHGIAGVDAAEFWRSGVLAAFEQFPDIEVVGEEYGNWSVSDAQEKMRAVLTAESEIDGVWVGGLEMGVSVINAFNEAGRPTPIMAGTNPINGFNRLAIENDVQFFAAPFSPASSKLCVETMFKILRGEEVQRFVDVTEVVEGTQPFSSEDPGEPEAHFRADFIDDWVGPAVIPDDAYIAGGFGR